MGFRDEGLGCISRATGIQSTLALSGHLGVFGVVGAGSLSEGREPCGTTSEVHVLERRAAQQGASSLDLSSTRRQSCSRL